MMTQVALKEGVDQQTSSVYNVVAGWCSLGDLRAHKVAGPKVVGSNPTPAIASVLSLKFPLSSTELGVIVGTSFFSVIIPTCNRGTSCPKRR